ncbi:MAG: glycine C-acetyltransferase [Cytophagia bacterium]|nr:glycine C-acetyltransferase [Cytophagia bacterium]
MKPYAQGLQIRLQEELSSLQEQGLYKKERVMVSPQAAEITLSDGRTAINCCANNYLGLSSHPRVLEAAHKALDSHGFGMSSVRFICGTQDIHKELEQAIAQFYGTEDSILYAAAFDANGGVFEPLLGEKDAIISDALNHASIIDGVRLCKAHRYRYANNNMEELEACLIQCREAGHENVLIVTDGVFSMDGYVAQLDRIVDLAKTYGAMTMVDECHAAGFLGASGRGTPELCGVHGQIDLVTGTLGKALGGAMGGYTTGRKEMIAMLRQRSRPYLFSNSLAPAIVGASLEVFRMLEESSELPRKLAENVRFFKEEILSLGFDIRDGASAIVPIMLYDAALSQRMADALLDEGVYVIGFFYPVVPQGQARIRVQLSAAHSTEQLQKVIDAFGRVGRRLGVIPA